MMLYSILRGGLACYASERWRAHRARPSSVSTRVIVVATVCFASGAASAQPGAVSAQPGAFVAEPGAPLAQLEEPLRIEPPVRPHVDIGVGPAPEGAKSEFALGLSMTSAPEYLGSDRRKLALRPILAYRYGRFKLSSSGGSSILNFGTVVDDSGASARLIDTKRWQLKASARIGGGRSASDSADLAGMPELRQSAFGRLSVRYKLADHWNVDSTLSADLLGRGNGNSLAVGVGYGVRMTPSTEITLGSGVAMGNRTHMQALFGVPESASTAQRPVYEPGAGLKDVSVGAGFTTELARNWIAFGGLGAGYLIGPAVDSPLTRTRTNVSATIGIGWRCCR